MQDVSLAGVFDSCQLKAARPQHFECSNKVCHVIRSLMYANEGVEGRERVHMCLKKNMVKWQKHCQMHKGTSKTSTTHKVSRLKTGGSAVKSTSWVWSSLNSTATEKKSVFKRLGATWTEIRGWRRLFMKLWSRSMIYEVPLQWSGAPQ